MIDVKLLEDQIEKSGLKISYISNKLGISRQGLRNKIRNGRFSTDEACDLCELLQIKSDSEKIKIFFAKK